MTEPDSTLAPLPPLLYESAVRAALLEDLGTAGDVTTDAIVPQTSQARGTIVAREDGRLAGIGVAACAFRLLDASVAFSALKHDGTDLATGETICSVSGNARALLSAERTALNFLGQLSGVATVTRGVVRAVSRYRTRVVCTRKTTPGLRALEKYAVRAGGGANHRFGLDDAVLIKDNHLVVAGSVTEAILRARSHIGHLVKIEVEVDNFEQLEEALQLNVDAVLLDNMTIETLSRAVRLCEGKAITEASGGITPANAAEYASTGVDMISVGWITHSARALDVSLDLAFSV